MAKLVTGGTGFIGAHLARALLKKGEEVVLFDIAPRDLIIRDVWRQLRIVRGDLSSMSEVLEVVKKYKIDGIFHTGALLSASAEENPLAGYRVNFDGTFNILEAARLFDVERVVFLSSIASYGPGVPETIDDETIQRPITIYGVSKVFGERLGEYYHLKFGVDFRGVRFPSVIGPGRGGGGASAYSTLMVSEPAFGRAYKVFVSEETVMPVLYIKDGVDALISLYEAPDERLRRRVYCIAGFSPTAREIVETIKKYLPEADLLFDPDPELDAIVKSWPRKVDESRAIEEWGWKTRFLLDETVKDFVQEIQTRRELYE